MNNNVLKGYLGFVGARGYSAYEVALQNGFIGTEQDWLATLGTSSHFDRCSDIYTTTTSGQTTFEIPDCYTNNSFIDVYVNGSRLNSDEYTINTSTNKIILTKALGVIGTKVEVVTLTMSTNSLPIAETISAESTNEVSAGAKAVYDALKLVIDDNNLSGEKTYSNNKINEIVNNIYDAMTDYLNEKANASDIQVLTGVAQNISAGGTSIVDVAYPDGFNKANTNIIGKMVSSNNNYYDVVDLTDTTSGFPSISMIALTDETIRLWIKNTSTSATRNGYYKITLLKK